ncbi:MAG TPA: c-type cytochrome [Caldilineaceae bacterium]|nr:c-type cytochrome [Caldilineaceae bacterium]
MSNERRRTGDNKRWRRSQRLGVGLALLALCLLAGGCAMLGQTTLAAVPGGDIREGAEALRDYGCGACHTIPGIPGANAVVGPPLNDWAARHYIAGTLPNTPDNLIRWIQAPQEIRPGTAMPNLGVDEETARHMSAYLFSLGRN